MLPISISADSPISVPASTPRKPHICAASLGENSSSTVRRHLADDAERDAGGLGLGVADRADGVGHRQHRWRSAR